MRLWHKYLIDVLPRQQLLGQWRECCAIMANIQTKGSPNHILVNKIMDYDPEEFLSYAELVSREMDRRGYRCNVENFNKYRRESFLSMTASIRIVYIFEGWHNERYLHQCFYNLQEKFDCGGISLDEWLDIDDKYNFVLENREKFFLE